MSDHGQEREAKTVMGIDPLPTSTPGRSILTRLSKQQVETLIEIASGHVQVITYGGTGLDYMGPRLVFTRDDLAVLKEAHLITDSVALTAAGREALVTAPVNVLPADEASRTWVRRLGGTR